MNRQIHFPPPCRCFTAAGALLTALLVLVACSRSHKPPIEQLSLGDFHVNTKGSSVEARFRTGSAVTNSTLGFEVRGIALDGTFWNQFGRILNGLSSGRLRLKIQLFSKDSTNDFYCAEFPLGHTEAGATNGVGANYTYSGNLITNSPLFFFAGIRPLGVYGAQELEGDATVIYHSQNTALTKDGKLLPDTDYRVKLTVISPVEITNEFQLVFYKY